MFANLNTTRASLARPPANRARVHDDTTMRRQTARVNAAAHRKPTSGERVATTVPCHFNRPPNPRGRTTPVPFCAPAREGAASGDITTTGEQ